MEQPLDGLPFTQAAVAPNSDGSRSSKPRRPTSGPAGPPPTSPTLWGCSCLSALKTVIPCMEALQSFRVPLKSLHTPGVWRVWGSMKGLGDVEVPIASPETSTAPLHPTLKFGDSGWGFAV